MDKKGETHSPNGSVIPNLICNLCEYFFNSLHLQMTFLVFMLLSLDLVLTLTITLSFFVFLSLLQHGSIDEVPVMLQRLVQSGAV